jgi:hypothetical protein
MLSVKLKGVKELQVALKASIAERTHSIVEQLREATPKDTGRAAAGWNINNDGDIINDVEYISHLNAGSSQQAPAHFVEKVVLGSTDVKTDGSIVQYR